MSVDDRSEARDSQVLDLKLQCFERNLAKAPIDWKQEVGLHNRLYNWVMSGLPEFANTSRMWHWLLNLPDREYCARIQLFSECFHSHFNGYSDEERIRAMGEHVYSHLPHILVLYAYALNTNAYKRQASDKTYQVRTRQNLLKDKIDKLMGQYSRILPYRFELYYREEFRNDISSIEFRQHLDEFSREIRKTFNFSDVGKQNVEILFFARVAEQGKKTGHFHVHCLIILDGKYHRNVHRFRTGAEALWAKITEGRGYLSDYQGKTSYGRPNISNCVIHRSETEHIESLYQSANYLAKIGTDSTQDQYLRIKPKGMDAFACSHRKK